MSAKRELRSSRKAPRPRDKGKLFLRVVLVVSQNQPPAKAKERKKKMARHEVVIHENTGALRETAPYVGNCISKEQIAKMAAFPVLGACISSPV